MPEIQKFVAIGEVKKPRADSVEADLRASRQKVRADARCSLIGGFVARSNLHGSS